MRRIRFFLLLLAWLAAVYTIWICFIPLVPAHVAPWNGRTSSLWVTPQGQLILFPRQQRTASRDFFTTGPLDFCDPQTGIVLRQVLTAEDDIIAVSADCAFAAVRGEGVASIVDLQNGDVRFTVPLADSDSRISLWTKAGLVLAQKSQYVVAYDLSSGIERWRQPSIELLHRLECPDLGAASMAVRASFTATSGVQSSGPRLQVINANDGSIVPAFAAAITALQNPTNTAIPPNCINVSTAGNWLVTFDGGLNWSILNSSTGQPIGKLASPLPMEPSFSIDGSEIEVWLATTDNRIVQARWKASNGEAIVAPPKDATPVAILSRSNDGRYVLVRRRVRSLTSRIGGMLSQVRRDPTPLQPEFTLQIVDNKIHKVIGPLPWEAAAVNLPRGIPGFALLLPKGIAYYSYPPLRDWFWLLSWSVGPPMLLWSIRATWLYWRRTCRSAGSSDESRV